MSSLKAPSRLCRLFFLKEEFSFSCSLEILFEFLKYVFIGVLFQFLPPRWADIFRFFPSKEGFQIIFVWSILECFNIAFPVWGPTSGLFESFTDKNPILWSENAKILCSLLATFQRWGTRYRICLTDIKHIHCPCCFDFSRVFISKDVF